MAKKIIVMGLVLALFCLVSAGLLAWVYVFTKGIIAEQARIKFETSLKEVLPQASAFTMEAESIYRGMDGERLAGYAVSVAPRGYSGKIAILAGVSVEGKIIKIKILEQTETAGLGANVIKPEFLRQFVEKKISDPIEPKKDIQAITGATISSRAVCRGVKEALEKIKP